MTRERRPGVRYQAMVFDLDGTLLDRRETFRLHVERQLKRHGDLFSPSEGRRYMARLLELDEKGHLDRKSFYQCAEAEFGLEAGNSAILLEDFERHFPETCVPLPNVYRTLRELRRHGLRLGLITNGRELIQSRKIRGLELRPLLDVIVISETVGVRKPNPEIFEHALDRLGVTASEAGHVGDHPEADVAGAKEAGLTAIWRQDKAWKTPEDADHVITDLWELTVLVGQDRR